MIQSIDGYSVAGVHAGLKVDQQLDFSLFVSDVDCSVGAVFTKNTVRAACVLVDMEHVTENAGAIRAVAVNTKHANACTGDIGIENAKQTAAMVANRIGCRPEQVLVLSTGVIGTQLPMDLIERGVVLSHGGLGQYWENAALGMLTTDTRPKLACVDVTLTNGATVRIGGVSKGSGMIAPNMATMLGLVFTDASMTVEETQATLTRAAEVSFNRIVVDGDMSTNDTVFLLANGQSGQSLKTDEDLRRFQDGLNAVSRKLAQDIVRDGEGVTKFVTLHVCGTETVDDARKIANTIATSALVKTALFGEDANWGRIIAAAGRAAVPFDPSLSTLMVQAGEETEIVAGAIRLFHSGTPTNYSEADASAVMRHPSISIILDCGSGDSSATVWTCDLSYDYVKINGDYRT
jgi:glutamate N-acetyltransferase/amino-acid N-acetyltransferase